NVDTKDVHVYKIISANGNTSYHKSLSSMLRKFDKQDLVDLHRLVMKRFKDNTLEGYNLLLWGDLKVMFEPNEEDEIWSNQQDWNMISWKLYENYGVHTLLIDGTLNCLNLLVEKRYSLIKEMLEKMLNWKLEDIDDLDFFKDFENEFPAIVYNDALTSKLEEQNVLYQNDLFPFNIIYLDNLKSDKGDDDNESDMIQSSRRLETIFGRQVNRVHILDFEGLTPNMRQDLARRLRMEYTGNDGQEYFLMHAEGRKSDAKLSGGHFIRCLAHHFGLVSGDGLRGLSFVTHMALPPRNQRYLWLRFQVEGYTEEIVHDFEQRLETIFGRQLSGGHFIRRLTHHFGLVSGDGLRGLSFVTREIPLIDIVEFYELLSDFDTKRRHPSPLDTLP
nr:hypothetical protein [Tanacetum cinerariifolium]